MDKPTCETPGDDICETQREHLRQILSANGWTGTELARRAGLAQSTIGRFMKGDAKNALSARTLAKIDAAVSGGPRALPNGFMSDADEIELIHAAHRSLCRLSVDGRKRALVYLTSRLLPTEEQS